MHISEILGEDKTCFSFEFFPPRTEMAAAALLENIEELALLEPSYVSVTCGAGGTARRLTNDLLVEIRRKVDIPVVAHLTCFGGSREEISSILADYSEIGIENVLALRGDPPQDGRDVRPPDDGFAYATDLVAFIRANFPAMGIGVAGYPEGHFQTPNRLKEMDYLKKKVDAGADYICTQLFFDNHDFYDFCDRCRHMGIGVPIIAGIMPVTSMRALFRMAELSAGSRIPAKLLRAVDRASTPEGVENVGIHWATAQVMDLLDNGVSGIHFFTLNKSNATRRIYQSLGVSG